MCDQRYTWAELAKVPRAEHVESLRRSTCSPPCSPPRGQGFALVPPEVSTTAMQAFLDGFSTTLATDGHAVMVADQAGWHVAFALKVPDNVTLVLLPPYSPELNPVERVWLCLRERHLSHRLLAGYNAIVDALCSAWNQLTPERLQTLTGYPYLNQVSF